MTKNKIQTNSFGKHKCTSSQQNTCLLNSGMHQEAWILLASVLYPSKGFCSTYINEQI